MFANTRVQTHTHTPIVNIHARTHGLRHTTIYSNMIRKPPCLSVCAHVQIRQYLCIRMYM